MLPPISWTDRHRAQASGLVWVAKRARPRVPRIGLQPELPVCGRWLFPGKPRQVSRAEAAGLRSRDAKPAGPQARQYSATGTRPASAPITVGDWQTVGGEPVARVTAAGRGGRSGQRGRYGIDGGYAGVAVFGLIEAGLAGAVIWAARRRRRAGQARDLGGAVTRAATAVLPLSATR